MNKVMRVGLMEKPRVLAIGAHPDDIEFMMAGTLIMLGRAGYEPHLMTVANGSCGTVKHSRDEIASIRSDESRKAAEIIGGVYHPGLTDDMRVFYEDGLLAKVAAVIREVNPEILLIPPTEGDYMEDHTNAGRLAVSATFSKGMGNFITNPAREPVSGNTFVYHALPYDNGMRQKVWAELYVDITTVFDTKEKMLSCHLSQKEWLDKSQAVGEYLQMMRRRSENVANDAAFEMDLFNRDRPRGPTWQYAEGWRQHSHLGFSIQDRDKLAEVLAGQVWRDPAYRIALTMSPAQLCKAVK